MFGILGSVVRNNRSALFWLSGACCEAGRDMDESGTLTVASWNIWGIPLASHAALSRPGRLGEVALQKVLGDRQEHPGRVVICFQEAWAYKTGLCGPLVRLARLLERCLPSLFVARHTLVFDPRSPVREACRVNSCFTLAVTLCATLSALCFPFGWLSDDSTREELCRTAARWGLPYAVGRNRSAGRLASPSKLMDSGLLLVSSVQPTASGFMAFDAQGVEGMAEKGMLWALLPAPPGPDADATACQLVVTTHMHADQPQHPHPASTREAQRAQLVAELVRLIGVHRPALVVLCGDFNEEIALADSSDGARGLHADLSTPPLSMTRLTDCAKEGTCLRDDGSGLVRELDHIYAAATGSDRPHVTFTEQPAAVSTPYSDQYAARGLGPDDPCVVVPSRNAPPPDLSTPAHPHSHIDAHTHLPPSLLFNHACEYLHVLLMRHLRVFCAAARCCGYVASERRQRRQKRRPFERSNQHSALLRKEQREWWRETQKTKRGAGGQPPGVPHWWRSRVERVGVCNLSLTLTKARLIALTMALSAGYESSALMPGHPGVTPVSPGPASACHQQMSIGEFPLLHPHRLRPIRASTVWYTYSTVLGSLSVSQCYTDSKCEMKTGDGRDLPSAVSLQL